MSAPVAAYENGRGGGTRTRGPGDKRQAMVTGGAVRDASPGVHNTPAVFLRRRRVETKPEQIVRGWDQAHSEGRHTDKHVSVEAGRIGDARCHGCAPPQRVLSGSLVAYHFLHPPSSRTFGVSSGSVSSCTAGV